MIQALGKSHTYWIYYFSHNYLFYMRISGIISFAAWPGPGRPYTRGSPGPCRSQASDVTAKLRIRLMSALLTVTEDDQERTCSTRTQSSWKRSHPYMDCSLENDWKLRRMVSASMLMYILPYLRRLWSNRGCVFTVHNRGFSSLKSDVCGSLYCAENA